jgi:phosphoenolpyruvate carboxykinase (ATP)
MSTEICECDLGKYGIEKPQILRNAPPAKLYAAALRNDRDVLLADNGALVAYSGEKTGRSPTEKRLVQQKPSQEHIWWGPVNIPLSQDVFLVNRERAVDYLNSLEQLYVVDGYAGADAQHRIKVRVICARPYHALFMHNMLIRVPDSELPSFGEPDFVVFNAGQFPGSAHLPGMTSKTTIDLNLEAKEFVILGSEYAGEMKKGVFTIMNYLMPRAGHLSMHCSCTEDPNNGSCTVLFGLSGTGKTTLSADPKRNLIGDDEHVWTDDGVFNVEGGCYAKVIQLSEEKEPDIFNAIRFGSVLENVVVDPIDHAVNYDDVSITQNTRVCYPIDFINNAKTQSVTGHPQQIIFLTCDAFGVLPPVSRLTPQQAAYHFISGYTAKVAGTEQGVQEPEATFSPCFGGPFLACHPGEYASLLSKKINDHQANVWLLNTGWIGGGYGVGQRIRLSFTRAIVDAIHDGSLVQASSSAEPIFGLAVPTFCAGVPAEILQPRASWASTSAYDQAAAHLVDLFKENFNNYSDGVPAEIALGGPA